MVLITFKGSLDCFGQCQGKLSGGANRDLFGDWFNVSSFGGLKTNPSGSFVNLSGDFVKDPFGTCSSCLFGYELV